MKVLKRLAPAKKDHGVGAPQEAPCEIESAILPGTTNRKSIFTFTDTVRAWFACTMSTGALAVVLGQSPYRFRGLDIIGKFVYILNVILLLAFTAAITARFAMKPIVIIRSLHHPTEGLFYGAFWVSPSLVLTGAQVYGVPSSGLWLAKALEICFWIYAIFAFVVAVWQYATLFVDERLPVSGAMPAWIFPAYPFLVIGSLAGAHLPNQPQEAALPIFIGAVMLQGLGWMLATCMYAIYIQRLMSSNLPDPSRRPAMYISVGPVGYTSAALVSLGSQATKVIPHGFLSTTINVGEVIKILGVLSGIFLWAVDFWFFCLSSLAVIQGAKRMRFTLQWWAFIFPNAGMTLALIQIGHALNNGPIKAVTSAMTILLAMAWVLVAVANVRAVIRRQILWDGMDEDDGMDLGPLKSPFDAR